MVKLVEPCQNISFVLRVEYSLQKLEVRVDGKLIAVGVSSQEANLGPLCKVRLCLYCISQKFISNISKHGKRQEEY